MSKLSKYLPLILLLPSASVLAVNSTGVKDVVCNPFMTSQANGTAFYNCQTISQKDNEAVYITNQILHSQAMLVSDSPSNAKCIQNGPVEITQGGLTIQALCSCPGAYMDTNVDLIFNCMGLAMYWTRSKNSAYDHVICRFDPQP